MAITKISPVKTPVKKTLDYVMNPHKTNDKLLVFGHACEPETAYLQFDFTKRNAEKTGGYQGFHLIQSFVPNEVDFETAHEIGKELADKIFGGKFAYVVATHVDKQHIHNHIVINSVSYKDKSKYNSSPQSYYRIRRASDVICNRLGLSIIETPKEKGKSHIEYTAEKRGVSWKSKLRETIDKNIVKARDYNEFLSLMQSGNYEIKQGKYVSFRAENQERFTRSKTLGTEYSEDRIRERIDGISKTQSRIMNAQSNPKPALMIDLEKSINAANSKGFEYWAKIENLKIAANTMNYLTENKINSYDDLLQKITDKQDRRDVTQERMKSTEKRIKDIEATIHDIEIYRKTKPVVEKLQSVMFKEKYRKENEADFILYAAAEKSLKKIYRDGKFPLIKTLRAEQNKLKSEKPTFYAERDKAYSEWREIKVIQNNIDFILGGNFEKERRQNRSKSYQLE